MSARTDYDVAAMLADLRAYTCPVLGCEAALRSGRLMCSAHWRRVAPELRSEVFEHARRQTRIARAYDRSSGRSGVVDHVNATPDQRRLIAEWVQAEQDLHEVQLRAVLCADERSGRRPAA